MNKYLLQQCDDKDQYVLVEAEDLTEALKKVWECYELDNLDISLEDMKNIYSVKEFEEI